jgi:hypothetical protein
MPVKPTKPKRTPRPKPVPLPLPYPGHGREKPLQLWNSSYRLDKLIDELTRTYYYTFRGYEGPHPWGLQARPPYPEYRPLPLKDPVGGSPYRTVIQEHLRSPQVRQRFLRTLYELRTLLLQVDPRNPKLRPRVTVPYDNR